ncbi:MAG: CopG family ribbon-helix-helix protein [Egibacteraceae bacterium]|jgi:metal-responsive CopG/Arc/MetJ family transcriptional regulator
MRPTRTITISLPPDLAAEVDREADAEGLTRSELARVALRQYLDRRDRWERLFAYGERVAQRLRVTEDDVLEAVEQHRGRAR